MLSISMAGLYINGFLHKMDFLNLYGWQSKEFLGASGLRTQREQLEQWCALGLSGQCVEMTDPRVLFNHCAKFCLYNINVSLYEKKHTSSGNLPLVTLAQLFSTIFWSRQCRSRDEHLGLQPSVGPVALDLVPTDLDVRVLELQTANLHISQVQDRASCIDFNHQRRFSFLTTLDVGIGFSSSQTSPPL